MQETEKEITGELEQLEGQIQDLGRRRSELSIALAEIVRERDRLLRHLGHLKREQPIHTSGGYRTGGECC